MITLRLDHHHQSDDFECVSVSEAAKEALRQLDCDAAFPNMILDGEVIVWKFTSAKTFREELEILAVEKADTKKLFVVRLYDGFDHEWMDISDEVSKEEAQRIWNNETGNGTHNTKFDDGDYYCIFPADTKMLFSSR